MNGEITQYKNEGTSSVGDAEEALDTVSTSKERGTWGNKVEFILSCVGFAVGFGNVVRFPYVCYESGGGAFLIPFCFFLFIAGLPMFFFELAIGQYSSSGPITVWKCVPLMKGLGYAVNLICFILTCYYSILTAWCFYYFWQSFQKELPWATCGSDPKCRETAALNGCAGDPKQGNGLLVNMTMNGNGSSSVVGANCGEGFISPAESFYFHNVLGITSSITELGSFQIHIVISLFLTWTIIFVALIKGIHSLGKVSYFTSTFPYLVLTALLIMALSLPGSLKGIRFYMEPDFEKLLDPDVWKTAASQIFFSFGIGWGSLIAFSSYNEFSNNCLRDAMIVGFLDCLTSIFAGFVVFAIIGFTAHQQGKTVNQALENNPGLAFIVYPTVVTEFRFPQVWSVLFFSMLIIVGCDTLFALVEGVVTAFCDQYPQKLRDRKHCFLLGYCFVSFVFGLFFCFGNGLYWFTLFDSYAAGVNLVIVGISELLIVSWVYGIDRFRDDINFMLDTSISLYWKICWMAVAPLSLTMVLVASLASFERAGVGTAHGKYTYPLWADGLGWLLVVVPFSIVPMCAIAKILKLQDMSVSERVRLLLKPHKSWGPRNIDDWYRDKENRPELYEKLEYQFTSAIPSNNHHESNT